MESASGATIVPSTGDIVQALFLTTIAGLSTGIGGVIVVLAGEPSLSLTGHMLSFSAGVMTFISFMDLLLEAVNEIGFFDSHFWFFFGMLFFAMVTWLIPEPDLGETLVERGLVGGSSGRRRGSLTASGSRIIRLSSDDEDSDSDYDGSAAGVTLMGGGGSSNQGTHDASSPGYSSSLLGVLPSTHLRRRTAADVDLEDCESGTSPRSLRRGGGGSRIDVGGGGGGASTPSSSKKHRRPTAPTPVVNSKSITDPALFKVAIYTAVGISMHNLPEGIAVFLACLKGVNVGVPLVVAIAAHNIPEGMAVAAPILGASGSKYQSLKWSFLSGACEPVAAMLVGLMFTSYLTDYVVQAGLGAVAGIMVFMSIRELLPTALRYISAGAATQSFCIGMFVIFLTVHWMNIMMRQESEPSVVLSFFQ